MNEKPLKCETKKMIDCRKTKQDKAFHSLVATSSSCICSGGYNPWMGWSHFSQTSEIGFSRPIFVSSFSQKVELSARMIFDNNGMY